MALPVKKTNYAQAKNIMLLNGYPTLVVAIHETSVSQHVSLLEIPICRQRIVDLSVRILYMRKSNLKIIRLLIYLKHY